MSPAAGSSIAFMLCAFAPWVAPAANLPIHKCLGNGRTLYQNAPCPVSQVSLPYRAAAEDSQRERDTSAARTVAESLQPTPSQAGDISSHWHGPSLAAGMSDTVVLNRPNWGRPQSVSGARLSNGYGEEWRYAADALGRVRVLRFLNGRLIDFEVEMADPPPQLALHGAPDAPAMLPDNGVPSTVPPRDEADTAKAYAGLLTSETYYEYSVYVQ